LAFPGRFAQWADYAARMSQRNLSPASTVSEDRNPIEWNVAMLDFLKSLFTGRDEERRADPAKQNALNKLEMDEPMAGAGAQVSAERNPTETEEILKRGD
jgi:hypothetical protein